MKDWSSYLIDSLHSNLWGFIALDQFYHEKEAMPEIKPSDYIDHLLDTLLVNERLAGVDPVAFHKVLLSLSVQLLGPDFEDITRRTARLVTELNGRLTPDQLHQIAHEYDSYGKRQLFVKRMEGCGTTIPGPSDGQTDGAAAQGHLEKPGHSSEMAAPISTAPVIKANQETIEEDTSLADRTAAGSPRDPKGKPLLFYSYSHKDEKLRDKLENHLCFLERDGLIEEWHDRKITAGERFDDKIDENLKKANVILLLISSDFIASRYCYSVEMEFALEQEKKKKAAVVPIILRSCVWKGLPFGKLTALPTDGKAVTARGWKNHDEAFEDIAEGIRRVIESLPGVCESPLR